MGKNQFPKASLPVSSGRQQAVWLVMQSSASSPSPISSKVTIVLFWYGVPLSTAAEKKIIYQLHNVLEQTKRNSSLLIGRELHVRAWE